MASEGASTYSDYAHGAVLQSPRVITPRTTSSLAVRWGVFSVTNEMRDGALVEVATVGIEGMLGIGVFLGDRLGAGRILQQVSDGPFPSMRVSRFVTESATPGPFHDVIALYAQATLLQIMQGTACNALHGVKQRCCRWLLQNSGSR